MKAYFYFIGVLEPTFSTMDNVAIRLKSYKIDGVETLTNEFYIDTQNVSVQVEGNGLYTAKFTEDGSVGFLNIYPAEINTWNPFVNNFLLNYPFINDAPRGLPTGTQNGNDYGNGVLNFGVDKPEVLCGDGIFRAGAFFIDIDFTKDLYIEFDVATTLNQGSPYEEPYLIYTGTIKWDVSKCEKSYIYYNVKEDLYVDYTYDYAFLSGATIKDEIKIPHLSIPCSIPSGSGCERKERTISHALFVKLPEEQQDQDEIFKECCYNHIVLASLSETTDIKNDYSAFYHQRQIPSETVEFILYRHSNNSENSMDGTYGTPFDFGAFADNPDLAGFLVQWRKVLNEFGEGDYKIIKRITIAGLTFDEESFTFSLKNYTTALADKTIRIDVNMNGKLIKSGVDFTNLNWKHSIRIPGFFGRREPKLEEDILVDKSYNKNQVSMKQDNEYKLQTNYIPSCITSEIWDFFLYGNQIFITDYNLNNHSYNFIKQKVRFSNNDGTGYVSTSRKAQLNLTFVDGTSDNLKRNFI